MSLLMDALKRAEEAKRQQNVENAQAAAGRLQLEPVGSVPSENRISPLPDLNSHLDAVDADLQATAAEHPTRPGGTTKTDSSIDRAVAQNVLAAGAAGASEDRAPSGSSRRIAAIVGLGVIAAAGVGAYFYWQLQGIAQNGNRLTGPGLAALPTRAPLTDAPMTPAPMTPAPLSPTTPAAQGTTLPTPAAPPPVASAEPAVGVIQPPLPGTPRLAAALTDTRSATPATDPTRQSAKTSPARLAIAPRPADSAVRPKRDATTDSDRPGSSALAPAPLQISSQSQESLTQRGYEALQAGRFADAKTAYTQALRADPRDGDALLGLATLAQRDGQYGSAGDYYERVLQNDPRNAAAHAGLSALHGGDPGLAESRLKSLLNQTRGDSLHAQNSDGNATAALNFALGNVYAGQRRWAEAQQAYFQAHTADPGNPDSLYNLAISLEHLNQKPLARQFYEQALLASQRRSAAFDRAQAEKRLAALTR